MQTLGLSDSTPRSEKSLFWPSIQTEADADYLGAQGYWVCVIVGALSLVLMFVTGQPISGFFVFLFFYLGGVGIRSGSRFAATIVLAFYVIDWVAALLTRLTLLLSPGIITKIIFTALLISNLRATWLAAGWKAKAEVPPTEKPPAVSWSDRFADRFPLWLWPKVRVLYYIYSACLVLLTLIGLTAILRKNP